MRVERVCILGGTGFVGRALTERLCARGIAVRVLTREPTRARPLLVLPTFEAVVADPHDEARLPAQLAGADAVVNLVGILNESRRQRFEAVHVELPRKVANACRAAGVRHFVHMSALGAAEGAPSEYLRSKARGEKAVRESVDGIPFTIFRPSVIFGPEDRFLNLFAHFVRWFPVVPIAKPGARFQPVWVDDVARAIAQSLGDSRTFGEAYEVCGPRVYTLRELVEYVAATLGRRRWIMPLPGWAATLQAFAFEHLPGKLITRDNLRSMSVDNTCGGSFPEVFGFEPMPLEAIVPGYLGGHGVRDRYATYRHRAGR